MHELAPLNRKAIDMVRTAERGLGMRGKLKWQMWTKLAEATFVIGSLDLIFVWAFWAQKGVTLENILQSIAAGWYGRAEAGQLQSFGAAIGAMSHYAIILMFIVVYREAGKRNPRLFRKWMPCGAVYGLALYVVMQFVVLPLSNAGPASFSNHAWVASSIAAHVLIGAMCAIAARKSVP